MRKKILVVDDNKLNRSILCMILSDEYDTIEAENGRVALGVLESEQDISVVMLELVMPEMDGMEFLEKMRATPDFASIPVVITTHRDAEEDEVKALALGASDFLTKPYKPLIIKHRVNNLIKLREAAALINLVEHDSLTGLYSRDFFYRNVERILSASPEQDFDIICLDIDNFKLVNDRFGTKTGDELLRFTAQTLNAMLPRHFVIGRLGADNFAALTAGRDEYDNEYFDEIAQTIDRHFPSIRITMRFGIYNIDDKSTVVSSMCDRAILAAKSIKGRYGLIYNVYDEKMRERMLEEQRIVANMEPALKNGEFKVYLQPKYNLSTELISGAEALVRWVKPDGTVISPGFFIPLFEQNGFISTLDQYVWEQTCRIISDMKKQHIATVPVSVNVSRADMFNPKLPEEIAALVKKYELSPEQLHIEITESAYTDNPRQIIDALKRLKELGFIIEMDDFGSGYSSLNMLSELPIDILKIDMKFIQNASLEGSGRNVLGFIISLAKWMGLKVIAEGVETIDQIKRLRGMECDYVQGYYYAKPMPENDYVRLLATSETYSDSVERISSLNQGVVVTRNTKRGRTMLIVDDAQIDRSVLAKTFSNSFNIAEAENGKSALEYLYEHPGEVEIVLLDLIMPAMDGFATLSKMKDDPTLCSIPVIVTSQAGENSERKAFALGAADYISKPYNSEICTCRVNHVCAFSHMKALEAGRESRSALLAAAYRDYLTGVYNRRGFDKALEGVDFNSIHGCFALFMIDLDDLKARNDTYGHESGDEMLRSFGEYLQSALRVDDIIARVGGDEFMVLMKNVPSAQTACKKGDRLCRGLGWEWPENGAVSCSVGIATFDERPDDMKVIIERADKALYRAKQTGKSACCLYDSSLDG